jgi:ankyrin repeat protein
LPRVRATSSWRASSSARARTSTPVAGDGKTALALAIFNGNYEVGSFLVDSKADVNRADAQRFTPLFYAVDRRNMETAPNFPWMVTADPMPLIRKMLDAGANPNALVNNTPRARMREGSPRIVFATALMRAAVRLRISSW